MKLSYNFALIWLGAMTIYVCLVSEYLLLRYIVLLNGIVTLVLGIFLEYKDWKTSPPAVKKASLWILLILVPMTVLLWYLIVIRGVRIWS